MAGHVSWHASSVLRSVMLLDIKDYSANGPEIQHWRRPFRLISIGIDGFSGSCHGRLKRIAVTDGAVHLKRERYCCVVRNFELHSHNSRYALLNQTLCGTRKWIYLIGSRPA